MRSQAVQIFTSLTEVVCSAGEYNRGLVKELLGPSLLPFTEALVKHLQEPDGPTSDVGLKTSIVKGSEIIRNNYLCARMLICLFIFYSFNCTGQACAKAAVSMAPANPSDGLEYFDPFCSRLRCLRR